ncbi:hypothetical protein Tco_0865632 [Tanacetum coccineum]
MVPNDVDELRAVSDHMLGASGVQISKNNLDNLRSKREEDGILETLDPRDCSYENHASMETLSSQRNIVLISCFVVTMLRYYGLKTKKKRIFSGLFRSRVLIIQDEDKVKKIPQACHWKEHEITSLTVPSLLTGPAHNPLCHMAWKLNPSTSRDQALKGMD